MTNLTKRGLLIALATLVAGCPSARSPDALPGIPGDLRLVDMNDAQTAQFCAWYIERWGGEGAAAVCSDGTPRTGGNMEECVTAFSFPTRPSCPTLVQTAVNYINGFADDCLSPGFDYQMIEGAEGWGCQGP